MSIYCGVWRKGHETDAEIRATFWVLPRVSWWEVLSIIAEDPRWA